MKHSFIKSSSNDGSPGLLPATDEAIEQLQKIPNGTELVLDIKRSRNPKFHRYAMVMMHRLHDMSDEDAGFNPWRKWMTIQAGYCSTTGFANGSVHVDADSLSFESMTEDKFQQCWRDIHAAFCKIYGKKITYNELCEWSEM